MALPLKREITYGPVRSRRLGRSLGINLLPPGRKVCRFDCQYCQYGSAKSTASGAELTSAFPTPEEVLEAVEVTLGSLSEPPAFLTLSGNGEPTQHPRLSEIVTGLTTLRDRRAPGACTAVLSNSTQLDGPTVRHALALLDVRIMKLDAGTSDGFQRINRPAPGIDLDRICAGLSTLPEVTLQALFATGEDGNLQPREVKAWLDRVVAIRPLAVQIYTLDRDPASSRLGKAPLEELEKIRAGLVDRGVPAEVFWR